MFVEHKSKCRLWFLYYFCALHRNMILLLAQIKRCKVIIYKLSQYQKNQATTLRLNWKAKVDHDQINKESLTCLLTFVGDSVPA